MACTSSDLAFYDDIYICRSCELARSVPTIGTEEIRNLYAQVEDPSYLESEQERRGSFRDALRGLAELRANQPPGRLLEVGSYAGLFLEEARAAGWDATGVEPSVWASETARSRGLNVKTGTLDELDDSEIDAPFDAVVMWDVFEHLVEPKEVLARIQRLLKPEGILCLTTVNIGGIGARIMRSRWPWFMRMHLHYFTRRSLTLMAEASGFEVVELRTVPKVLKIGYVLERARGLFGPLASIALWTSKRVGLAEIPVSIDLGDILQLTAKNKSA